MDLRLKPSPKLIIGYYNASFGYRQKKKTMNQAPRLLDEEKLVL